MSDEYIFVYGTLRRNPSQSMYHVLARYSDFVGDGYVHGKLYEVDNYPGLKTSDRQEEKVYGEVYRLRDPHYVFEMLDDYEECSSKYPEPHEYKRAKIDVHTTDGRKLKAWAYEYNHPTEALELIPSGNYVEYLKKKSNKAN